MCTICFCNINCLTDHFFSKIPRIMVIDHGTNRRTCDCCESIYRQVYKKLAPYDTLNIIRNFYCKSTFLKQI